MRMKAYERSVGTTLDRGFPAIIRVDGRAFKSYTGGFVKPFDDVIGSAMKHTAEMMCEEVQGTKIAYSHSDEIMLLMTAYDNPKGQLWFDGRVQKIASNAASVATEAFNEYMVEYWQKYPLLKRLRARFDARTFNLPFIEVNNCFHWRYSDAVRNSKQTLGMGTIFAGKSFMLDKWQALPFEYKTGFCVMRTMIGSADPAIDESQVNVKYHWVHCPAPDFDKNRDYINQFFEKTLLTE